MLVVVLWLWLMMSCLLWILLMGEYGVIGWVILGLVVLAVGLFVWIDTDTGNGEEE